MKKRVYKNLLKQRNKWKKKFIRLKHGLNKNTQNNNHYISVTLTCKATRKNK